MTICFFGIYDPLYSRNRVLLKGLKSANFSIIECDSRIWGVRKYFDLLKKFWKIRKDFDVMIVGFSGFQVAIFARLLTRKPIVFDAFFSLHDTLVNDRKEIKRFGLLSVYYWLIDWLSCALSDVVLLDTDEHIDYFVNKYKINRNKFIRIYVGTDDEVFTLRKKENDANNFLVHFHGSFIPLHGVDCVIDAAKSLADEDVRFNIIGSKMKRYYADKGEYNNIEFIDNVSYEKLGDYIAQADVCLGVFGDTQKAKKVIPNKVFESIACGRPVITGRTKAIEEAFTDKENIILCNMNDARDLADKILQIKNDKELKIKIGDNGYRLFVENFTPNKIIQPLVDWLNKN